MVPNPLIKEWIANKIPAEYKISPIIEFSTRSIINDCGIKIKDILNKGLSIKLFNKEKKFLWHPIFVKDKYLRKTIYTTYEQIDQSIFEIVIGETKKEREYDVVFENGLPKLSEKQSEEEIFIWDKKPLQINLKKKCHLGEDSLKLFFRITENADFYVECFEIDERGLEDLNLGEFNLGNIF